MTDVEKDALERRIDELCQEVEAEKQHNAKLLEAAEKWMAKAAHFELENSKLRELAVSYDSALHRMCNQMQGHVDCHDCILGKDYGDDWCAIDELREAVYLMKVDLDD